MVANARGDADAQFAAGDRAADDPPGSGAGRRGLALGPANTRPQGRDPAGVGIIWAIKLIVGETKAEADALREKLIANVPPEAVGVWLSHNTGFDMSTLPSRFSLGELQDIIVAANASPLGVVGLLMREHGASAEFTLL